MRIDTHPNVVELHITDITAPDSPRPGDVRIEFNASVGGFAGRGSCWVAAEHFQTFASAVRQLYLSSKGLAKLVSMSPGEMSLSLSPANSRGYILLRFEGSKSLPFECSMSGAFEVELSALARLVSWSERPHIES
jgi:hypothetical protein